jgi:hypothetical protein
LNGADSTGTIIVANEENGAGVCKVRKVVSTIDERIFDQNEMVKRILLFKMREIIAERPIQHGEAQCDLLEKAAL